MLDVWSTQIRWVANGGLHAKVLGHRGLHEHGDDGLQFNEFIQTGRAQE